MNETTWEYCPECGGTQVTHSEKTHRKCWYCKHDWYTDIDYTPVVRAHLRERRRMASEEALRELEGGE